MVSLSTPYLSARTLQALSGLLGMVFTSLGYIEMTTGQISSASAILAMIANYSAVLCGVYYIFGLHVLKLSSSHPKLAFQRAVDGVLMAALTLAGVLHATSDSATTCEATNAWFSGIHKFNMFRCAHISAGIAFTFVAAAATLVTLTLSIKCSARLAMEDGVAAPVEYAVAATPKTAAGETAVAASTAVARPALRRARLGGRTMQFAVSVIALFCTAYGYRHYFMGQYLSPKAMFTILLTYTSAVYSLWHLVAVEKLRLSRRPQLKVERMIDALLVVALVIAGITFASSPHIADCDATNAKFMKNHGAELFRCDSMNSGVVFTFLSVAAFAMTFGVSFMYGAVEEHAADSARDALPTVVVDVQA
ncbi:hypothetical protein ATCC90586_003841 [Pythium insidiosum]|nr:hypothetical protein ATCC90586_003841 [Pythium insidiosum]